MKTKLKGKETIPGVISELTTFEKAVLMTGRYNFSTCALPERDIPEIHLFDCASGVNLLQVYMDALSHVNAEATQDVYTQDEKLDGVSAMLKGMDIMRYAVELSEKGLKSKDLSPMAEKAAKYIISRMPGDKLPTCFPDGMMLGASWNPTAVKSVSEAVGTEAAAYKVDVLLGSPNVNIHRDPRNGRLFEGLSEDPCLVSNLAPELVTGLQSSFVGANIKHFAANNQETRRIGINEHISERALREIYLPGFKACVGKGRAMSVMSAYNSINSVACSHNKWLLTDVLRNEWGFKGFTVCDWGGNYDRVASVRAGVNLDMPGPRAVKDIMDAVEDGSLEMSALDDACANLLNAIVEIKENRERRANDFSVGHSAQAAYLLASEAITLLKNDGVLPLKENAKISFFGEKCDKFLTSGEGSALVITDRTTSLKECAAGIVGKENVYSGIVSPDADAVVIAAGKTSSEGYDHVDLSLPESEYNMVKSAVSEAKKAGKKIIFILNSGGPCDIGDFIDDFSAVIWVYYPGQEGGRAAADVLFGRVNPSGKLPLTYPKKLSDCPAYQNFPGEEDDCWYGEGVFVGYRWYDARDIEPLFPFGHGLSYSSFELGDMRLDTDSISISDDQEFNVSLSVRNTGAMAGSEVVQLYISNENPRIPKPPKELKAFRKVFLQPGEEKRVSFRLTASQLSSFHPKYSKWIAQPGDYKILAGVSSRDIRLTEKIHLSGHTSLDYGVNTPYIVLWNDPRARQAIFENVKEYMTSEEISGAMFFTPFLELGEIWDFVFGVPIAKKGADPDKVRDKLCAALAEIDISV